MDETEREAGDQYGAPGGSAMYRGANYQALVAAYFAALALSESRNAIPPEIPASASPSRIGAEQHWPVDDVDDRARAYADAIRALVTFCTTLPTGACFACGVQNSPVLRQRRPYALFPLVRRGPLHD